MLSSMTDYYETDETHTITGAPVQPQRYNIVLTQNGEELQFDFPPASADLIVRFGYIKPEDARCSTGLVEEDDDLYGHLKPVLGASFTGEMGYHTRKQVIISLHDTAVLGYQRQSIIDPRISNEVATFWEIYLDQRIFPEGLNTEFQGAIAQSISLELGDETVDQKLAEEIKAALLNGDEE